MKFELKKGSLKNYEGLFLPDSFRGEVFSINKVDEKYCPIESLINNGQSTAVITEIGFVFYETFFISQREGTFHTFVLPSIKVSRADGKLLIKEIFKTGFEKLNLKKLYTMVEEKRTRFLVSLGMTDTTRCINKRNVLFIQRD